jgi:hypothetical protein
MQINHGESEFLRKSTGYFPKNFAPKGCSLGLVRVDNTVRDIGWGITLEYPASCALP